MTEGSLTAPAMYFLVATSTGQKWSRYHKRSQVCLDHRSSTGLHKVLLLDDFEGWRSSIVVLSVAREMYFAG